MAKKRIPIEDDLRSPNHEIWVNAVMQCKGHNPYCGADGYCSLEGKCFEPVRLEETEAQTTINLLTAKIEELERKQSSLVLTIDAQLISLKHNYQKALKAGQQSHVWAYELAMQTFQNLKRELEKKSLNDK